MSKLKDDKVYVSNFRHAKGRKKYKLNHWFLVDEFLSLCLSNKKNNRDIKTPTFEYTVHGDKNIIGEDDTFFIKQIISIKNNLILTLEKGL
jgi:hypothetical protein